MLSVASLFFALNKNINLSLSIIVKDYLNLKIECKVLEPLPNKNENGLSLNEHPSVSMARANEQKHLSSYLGARIPFAVPPFYYKNPSVWFEQIEALFALANIHTEEDKFNMIVGTIETCALEQVFGAIMEPLPENMYANLKERLLEQFGDINQKATLANSIMELIGNGSDNKSKIGSLDRNAVSSIFDVMEERINHLENITFDRQRVKPRNKSHSQLLQPSNRFMHCRGGGKCRCFGHNA